MIQIKLDKGKNEPYYSQIQKRIESAIEEEEIPPGTKLPSIRKWAPLIGVNMHTLNKSLCNLAKEGIICRRRSLGTYVSEKANKKVIEEKDKKVMRYKVLVFFPERDRLTYPYTQEVMKGLFLQALTYDVDIEAEVIDQEKEFSWEKFLIERKPDGILIDKEGFLNKGIIKLIENYDGKIGFFNSTLATHREIPSVIMDNEKGAYLATEYLIKKGHRKIAIILRSNAFSPIAYITDSAKYHGYELALEKHGIKPSREYQKTKVYSKRREIELAIKELLKLKFAPTAILCADDLIAFEILNILKERLIKVPEDISIIGFNNFVHSKMSQPKLTTVETSMNTMGHKMMEILFEEKRIRHEVLGVELIERDSVSSVRTSVL